MIDWLRQLFCKHEFKKLKDESFLCEKCDFRRAKTIPDIRKTNNYYNNLKIIKRRIKTEEEKERLKNESVR
jgi:hypothetical protein